MRSFGGLLFVLFVGLSTAQAKTGLVVSLFPGESQRAMQKTLSMFNRQETTFSSSVDALRKAYPQAKNQAFLDQWAGNRQQSHLKLRYLMMGSFVEVRTRGLFIAKINGFNAYDKSLLINGVKVQLDQQDLKSFHKSVVHALEKRRQRNVSWVDTLFINEASANPMLLGAAFSMLPALLGVQKESPENKIVISRGRYCQSNDPSFQDQKYAATTNPNHDRAIKIFLGDPSLNEASGCQTASDEFFQQYSKKMKIEEDRRFMVSKLCRIAMDVKKHCESSEPAPQSQEESTGTST